MKRTAMLALALALAAAGVAHAQSGASRLKKIAGAKTITIAYRADATPFSFTENKEIGGFSIDVCKRVVASIEQQLKIEGLQIKWHPVTLQDRFDAVARGQADMECGSSTVTLTRMKQVDFSSYIYVESTGILVKANSGVRRFSELEGRRIGVVVGTTNEAAVHAQLKRRLLSATVVAFKTREEAFGAFEGGKVDAFASDKMLLLGAASKAKDPKALFMLPDELSFEPYGIVLPRGDSDFRLAVNTGLARLYESGEIEKVFGKWFGAFGDPGPITKIMYILGSIPE